MEGRFDSGAGGGVGPMLGLEVGGGMAGPIEDWGGDVGGFEVGEGRLGPSRGVFLGAGPVLGP